MTVVTAVKQELGSSLMPLGVEHRAPGMQLVAAMLMGKH